MSEGTPGAKHGKYLVLGWVFALLACVFGVMLLVVGKVAGGIAFLLAGLLSLPALSTLAATSRLPKWARVAAILFFWLVAVVNISGTDIPPSNSVTGIKFLDQILTLWGAFWERIL
ncbi:MAG: hypothetical protein AMXMBFR84_19690 [Candidatus Hydrogenedentota bacterium]